MKTETLIRAMPGLPYNTAKAYLPPMEKAMREYGITTLPRIQMWLAQVGHESVSLRYMEEIASGAAYEGRSDLGNTKPGDGRRYKGRGPIQLTGRANYTRAGAALKLPLESSPTMAANPNYAFRVSAWWWWNAGLNPISDSKNVLTATRRINGGTNGLSDRQNRYGIVTKLGNAVLLGPGGDRVLRKGDAGQDVKEVQTYLLRGGYLKKGNKQRNIPPAIDGDFGEKTAQAVKQFQRDSKIKSDGVVGSKTITMMRNKYKTKKKK